MGQAPPYVLCFTRSQAGAWEPVRFSRYETGTEEAEPPALGYEAEPRNQWNLSFHYVNGIGREPHGEVVPQAVSGM